MPFFAGVRRNVQKKIKPPEKKWAPPGHKAKVGRRRDRRSPNPLGDVIFLVDIADECTQPALA